MEIETVINELREIDILNITPITALNILARLQSTARNISRPSKT
jgi:hypothetical protein